MITLIEFSRGMKQLLKNKLDNESRKIVNKLPMGKSKMKIEIEKSGNTIKLKIKSRDIQSVFDIINNINPQKDYDYTINVAVDGKIKKLNERSHPSVKIKEIRERLLLGEGLERIYYEKISTDSFEITSDEYNGIVIKCKDENCNRYFNALTGLFPYADVDKDSKKVEIEFRFNLENYEMFKKDVNKRLNVVCYIKVDGEPKGAKSGIVIF